MAGGTQEPRRCLFSPSILDSEHYTESARALSRSSCT